MVEGLLAEVAQSTPGRITQEPELDDLEREPSGSARAMDGWSLIKTQEDWEETVRQAALDLDNGSFLIDRLGAERHLESDCARVRSRHRVLSRPSVGLYGVAPAAI